MSLTYMPFLHDGQNTGGVPYYGVAITGWGDNRVLRFYGDGRITTPKGEVSFGNDATGGTINGGWYTKVGNILTQYFDAGYPGDGTWIDFPMHYAQPPIVLAQVIGDGTFKYVDYNCGTPAVNGFTFHTETGGRRVFVSVSGPAE